MLAAIWQMFEHAHLDAKSLNDELKDNEDIAFMLEKQALSARGFHESNRVSTYYC